MASQTGSDPEAGVEPVSDEVPLPERSLLQRWRGKPAGYLRRLDHVGALVGLFFFAISLTPSLLPRVWAVQGLLSGISFAIGYGIGTTMAALIRPVVSWRPGDVLRRRARWGVWGLAIVTVVVMLWLGSAWQNDVRTAVDLPSEGRYLYAGVFVVAILVAALLLGIARLLRWIGRKIAIVLARWLPRPVAIGIAVVLTALLAWGFINHVLLTGMRSGVERVFEAADALTQDGDARPTSPLRSGSPESLVSWDELGREGRTVVANGPTAADITAFTGRPALEPIRVYAGLQGEADVVLAELTRTHAFDRKVLAVAVTTGSGWIPQWQSGALEYIEDGDTAMASMQYSYFPSWISFLIDRDRALEAGRVLFTTVYAHWSTLPVAARPRLVVNGESLGAYGGSGAFTDLDDLLARTQGALFTGPPNSTTLWATLTRQRVAGSPEIEPVWPDPAQVRFVTDTSSLRAADGTPPSTHLLYIQHASDPITWWSPRLLWSRPDWLSERRGGDVIPQMRYIPLVTFWQVTLDMIGAVNPPDGHGHSFGSQVVEGWVSILHPADWTQADSQRLVEQGIPRSRH